MKMCADTERLTAARASRACSGVTKRGYSNGSWMTLRSVNKRESGQGLASDMSSETSMDVVELAIYGVLALWGLPLLFAAYLLQPIRSAASRSRQ
jgi:hypothetical protein